MQESKCKETGIGFGSDLDPKNGSDPPGYRIRIHNSAFRCYQQSYGCFFSAVSEDTENSLLFHFFFFAYKLNKNQGNIGKFKE